LGENTPILVHDVHDSTLVWYKVLAESGQIFGSYDSKIDQVMNGIPRFTFPSEFNVIAILYLLFEPYSAYIINISFMHILAFIGMYLLLSRHALQKEELIYIVIGVSLAFSLLPFNPYRGLGIAGMPLLLYAFLNIRSGDWQIYDWLIIGFTPFYSLFALTGFFVLCSLILFWLYDLIKTKKFNSLFFLAITVLGLLYCIVEYRLIYCMFIDSGYISNRVEFGLISTPIDIWGALYSSFNNLFYGQYHFVSLQNFVILPSVIIAGLILFLKKQRCDLFIILIGICLLISLFYGINGLESFLSLKNNTLFKGFQLTRFISLHPLLWFIIFSLALKIIHSNIKYGKQIVIFLIIVQVGFLFTLGGGGNYQYGGAGLLRSDHMTFNEFFSPELFAEIDHAISLPKDSYRVVSIGMHPSVSQFNGFFTLDSYQSNYPLEYKHSFREIIVGELEKSEHYQKYFDNWGNRCYIFSEELDKNNKGNINLTINSHALYDMGGRYIFSTVDLQNFQEINLEFINIFENNRSPYKIWLYSVSEPK
jgi:hypothetical protein